MRQALQSHHWAAFSLPVCRPRTGLPCGVRPANRRRRRGPLPSATPRDRGAPSESWAPSDPPGADRWLARPLSLMNQCLLSRVAFSVMSDAPDLDPGGIADLGVALTQNIRRAVKVSDEVVRDVIVALFAEGHVLIEDHPGVGKTALARSLARSLDAEYARVQCTADLLPADVVGTNVFNQREARFEFHPGPVFANVVLVDEINRTSPKTQSGLLECMQERRVTVDGHPHELARPFIVLATQNPSEYEGTYPLPEAQLDRFTVRVSMGYPSADDESAMLDEHAASIASRTSEPYAMWRRSAPRSEG